MKKSITFSLIATLGFGACVGLAACNEKSGGGNGEPSLSPEEVLLEDLLANAQADDMLCMEAETDVDMAMGGAEGSLNMQLTFDMRSGTPLADLFGHIKTDETDAYFVEFIRGGTVYMSEGAWPASANGFDALAGAFKTSNGPVLEQVQTSLPGEQGGDLPELSEGTASLPFAVKLMGNMPRLLGVTAREKTNGYVIEFDLIKGLNGIVGRVSDLLDTVSANTTLGDLIGKGYLDEVLNKLFDGIKASEFFEIMNYTTTVLPDFLPDAGDKTLYGYVHELLSSKEFYSALREGSQGALPAKNSLGEVTLAQLAAAAGAPDGALEGYLITAKTLLQTLKSNVIGGIIAMATGGNGYGTLDTAKVSILFNAEKKLTGMDVEMSGLEVVTLLPEASSPQSTAFTASGTIGVTFPAEVSLASLSGMRYYSDEYVTGVLAEGTWEPMEADGWYLELGKPYGDSLVVESPYEIEVIVGRDDVTFCLNDGEEISFRYTIPMEEIGIQLEYPDNIIAEEFRNGVYEDISFAMTLWFQFTEETDGYLLEVQYQALVNGVHLSSSSYGYGFLPEVFLPFARTIKTIA